MGRRSLAALAALVPWLHVVASAQERNPFSTPPAANPAKSPADDSARVRRVQLVAESLKIAFKGIDSVSYRLAPASRLTVKTGKAGLFGFAGHAHLIQARSFSGTVVYYPHQPSQSHLTITVLSDSLQVLTPPDTEEIRKVTAVMRTDVLHTERYPEIRLVSKSVAPSPEGFHIIGELTLAGRTRDIPLDVRVQAGADSLRAQSQFAIKQTDFGIKPVSAGPAGTVKVADKVAFEIDVVAIRRGLVSTSMSR
jgi:polyisoprenoid-binding protein YceI